MRAQPHPHMNECMRPHTPHAYRILRIRAAYASLCMELRSYFTCSSITIRTAYICTLHQNFVFFPPLHFFFNRKMTSQFSFCTHTHTNTHALARARARAHTHTHTPTAQNTPKSLPFCGRVNSLSKRDSKRNFFVAHHAKMLETEFTNMFEVDFK
jgi:hypothetical protein